MRLQKKELNALQKRYNVDRIWSFSKVNSFLNCPWEYKMKYIDKIRIDNSNAYTVFGTASHDIIQDFYEGKYPYEEMKKKWDAFVTHWKEDPKALQFDTDKIKDGYLNNIEHYFQNCSVVNDPEEGHGDIKVINEKPVRCIIDRNDKKYVFIGYVDSEYYDEEGNLVLLDYKTSSKSGFSPKKLPEKSMQLILYAIGKHQITGLPYDKIKCRFDMMKYCKVHYKMENGNWKTSIQERSDWVYKMGTKLRSKLPKVGVDPIEADELIIKASVENTMDCLPVEVQEQFRVENYYIEVEISEEIANDLVNTVADICDEVLGLEDIEDLDNYLNETYEHNPDDYFCKKLCAFHSRIKAQEEHEILQMFEDDGTDVNLSFDEDDLAALLAS